MLDRAGYALIAALVLYALYRLGPDYWNPYIQNDDTRSILFPLWSLHSDQFEGDFLARVMGTQLPWVYRVPAWTATLFCGVPVMAKLFQALAPAWTALHGFRLGHRRAGGPGALLFVWLVLHGYEIHLATAGGLPRAFAYPAMMLLIDMIDAGREKSAAASVVLAFALYPPGGFLAFLLLGFWYGARWSGSGRDLRRARAYLLKLVLVGLAFMLLWLQWSDRSEFGRPHTRAEAEQMPEFGVGGRLKILPQPSLWEHFDRYLSSRARTSGDSPLPWLENLTPLSRGAPLYAALLFAVYLAIRRETSLRPLGLFAAIVLAGLTGYALANLLAYRLYDPQRMLNYSLPLALIVLPGAAFCEFGRRWNPALGPRVSALVAFVCFIAFFGVAWGGPIGHSIDARGQRDLFRFVQTLPEDALLAGHPRRMDNIPLWGRRRILIGYETSQPWFTRLWEETRRRTRDNLEAYYAVDPEPLRRLRERYGVDYMLIHASDIGPDYARHAHYFRPFDELVRELTARPHRELIWHRAPAEAVVGRASGFVVLDLEKFLGAPEEPLREN